MAKKNVHEFVYLLSVWEKLFAKMVHYPAWDPEDMARALAMWAFYYNDNGTEASLDYNRYIQALADIAPGAEQYFIEYIRGDEWTRWDATWCGMHVEFQMNHLRNINHLMDLIEKTHRPMASPRDLMQLFTGVSRLFVEIKDVEVEQFDNFSKELMKRDHVTHPEADWAWSEEKPNAS
ncbi:hypothetical protein FDI21_gp266 [Pseudomonas phage Noxifer]|uniref:Uncharacterized protein n=1 Tax=Pseudomonas phage Noxifer TaxID=2006684 RepID=A0A1Y0SY09_9CAUD|nr:hypothetical protein FDI21_gp266 [Pseudomonas phage Noxifer]ARV77445.1 hypothetical protein NOXIFER_280 [Pseudomonas phage Noxifer]